jgi:hypothetical protein
MGALALFAIPLFMTAAGARDEHRAAALRGAALQRGEAYAVPAGHGCVHGLHRPSRSSATGRASCSRRRGASEAVLAAARRTAAARR